MEPEEDAERQRHSLNDHPRDEAKHFGLDGSGGDVLALKSDDDPHREIEEAQKVAHVPARHADCRGAI